MKIFYRPEIDGLRAIAVSAVILYHAQITINGQEIFKGGFIGVDIFFVISGYLISLIIFKELNITGTFSFKSFYERRVRRILPALLFVMLVSLPFAWIYLLPDAFIEFSKSILYSLGFSSNFYFWYSGQIYGDQSALYKPFLHTWSLSVEEQFYIIFPIVLLILFKYFKKYLASSLIFIFVVSLCLAEWGSRNYASATFYFLYSRIWELLVGSILAYFEIILGHRGKQKIFNLIFPSIGLILIGLSILFFNNQMLHPSFLTLSPIIGVCLIIWFSNKDELVTKLLSTKLFVGIGLISYSLYLWHYPIFAFSRIYNITEGDIFKKLLLGIIILVLSIFSYYFIERPFRNKQFQFLKIIRILAFSTMIIFLFNLICVLKEGFEKRNHLSKIVINTYKTLKYGKITQNGINCRNRLGDKGFCIFNQSTDNIGDIVLVGDSLSDALLGNLIDQVSDTKFRLIQMNYSGNLYLPNFVKFNKNEKKIFADENWHEFRKNYIKNKTNKNTYIIFYGDYNYYFERRLKMARDKIVEYETHSLFAERNNLNLNYDYRKELLKNKIEETLKEISQNKKVILVYPSPASPVHILQHITKKKVEISKNRDFYLKDKINYSKNFYRKYYSDIIELFDKINHKNIHKIRLEKVFCPQEKCIFYDNEKAFIFDTQHPSYEGSEIINNLIMEKINKIESISN
jgi:peptidoglycan/LPS O-acetylase OafA/YrhL